MTFVGMYADTSPAWVSMIGRAVSDPLPLFSFTRAERDRYHDLGIDSPLLTWGCHPELIAMAESRATGGRSRADETWFYVPGSFMGKRKPFAEIVEAFTRARGDHLRLLIKAQVERSKAPEGWGFEVKQRIVALLRKEGHEVLDFGPHDTNSVDYPDYAIPVAQAVSRKEADRGILVCGTGIGMCITANKVPGVRAAPCHDSITAEMSRRHNDANILCLSADLLGDQLIDRMLHIWLTTEFEGGRHARRVEKITRFEGGNPSPTGPN